MIVCNFSDIKQEIAQHIKDRRLIPVLGSGFSVGCKSKSGSVPSGRDMLQYMIETIESYLGSKSTTKQELEKKTFAQISTYYHKLTPSEMRRKYIRDNFTGVILDTPQRDFVNTIEWLYIYTLNMDDAIERNSSYNQVVLSNKEVDIAALDDYRCTIKLHGDANNYLLYKDDNSQIFDFKQYAQSITNNSSLLKKLKDDFTYNNLVFIGCSLDSEFDLATIDTYEATNSSARTSKYYCAVNEPDEFKKIELEEYGITHVVLFDSYAGIYTEFLNANAISKEIDVAGIEYNCNVPVAASVKEPIAYLLHGKNPFNIKKRLIQFPPFFINRDIELVISEHLDKCPIHILYGPRVSGKTYVLLSFVRNIQNRKVYFFDSRERISASAFEVLIKQTNSLFLFDTHSLSKDQIYHLLYNSKTLKNNKNQVIFAVNTSDKDIISIINNSSKGFDIKGYSLDAKFSSEEISDINLQLNKCEFPNFNKKLTLIDNIITIEKTLITRSMFSNITPKSSSICDLVVLILLAVNEKLYTTDLSIFDVDMEGFSQVDKASPLISTESSLYFERDIQNTSNTKIILNAKYWLFRFLGDYAETKSNHKIIVEAYQHIVKVVIDQNKKKAYSASMDYIKFDVINEIFLGKSKGQLGLAKSIYEGLSSLLADNAHYYHQRAKCYLWQSGFHRDDLEDLNEALKYAKISQHNFKIDYDKACNEKVAISLANVNFTIALIQARISDILDNQDIALWEQAIESIYNAIISPYTQNDFEYEFKKKYRKRNSLKNVIEHVPGEEQKSNKECIMKLQVIYKELIST